MKLCLANRVSLGFCLSAMSGKGNAIVAAVAAFFMKLLRTFESYRRNEIDLEKVREYNLALAAENEKLWRELRRLKSPLAAKKDAEFLAAVETANEQDECM